MTASASLRLQLNQFFKHCPEGDYLTSDDAAEKFDVQLSWAYRTLRQMVSEGLLEEFKAPSRKVNRLVVAYRAVRVEVVA